MTRTITNRTTKTPTLNPALKIPAMASQDDNPKTDASTTKRFIFFMKKMVDIDLFDYGVL